MTDESIYLIATIFAACFAVWLEHRRDRATELQDSKFEALDLRIRGLEIENAKREAGDDE